MTKVLVGGGGILIVLLGGWYLVQHNSKDIDHMTAADAVVEKDVMADEVAMDKSKDVMGEDSMEAEATMMKESDVSAVEETKMTKEDGTYIVYDESKLAMANTGDIVLFFKATWCPSCRALDSDLKANLSVIPSTLTIMEVDYDTSTALKQKYGVTTQHTLVQVAADGSLIKKWSGGATLASVTAQVQ